LAVNSMINFIAPKKMKKYIINIALGFLFVSCSANNTGQALRQAVNVPNFTVEETSSALRIQNGVCYYNDGLFSGYIISRFKSGALKERSPYFNGLKEGTDLSWFENGYLESERDFVKGEKEGTHKGWYEDGSKRFEYNFKNGLADGESLDWYRNGKLFQQKNYSAGNEVSVKAWGEAGKLYANYEVKNGVIYGLNNSTLCYTLKNERGEYVSKK